MWTWYGTCIFLLNEFLLSLSLRLLWLCIGLSVPFLWGFHLSTLFFMSANKTSVSVNHMPTTVYMYVFVYIYIYDIFTLCSPLNELKTHKTITETISIHTLLYPSSKTLGEVMWLVQIITRHRVSQTNQTVGGDLSNPYCTTENAVKQLRAMMFIVLPQLIPGEVPSG